MTYDLADEPPPLGSLLESVFLLTVKRRQEADWHKTRALIAAVLAPNVEEGGKALKEALDLYTDCLFPFLGATKKNDEDKYKKVLKRWTEDITAMKIRPLGTLEDRRKLSSKLQRGSNSVKAAEELRRAKKHERI
jgi:hypothetical protein